MRFFSLLSYTLVFILFSCSYEPNTKIHLSKIDSLSISLEESAATYTKIDTAYIRQYYLKIEDQLNEVIGYDNIINTKAVISFNTIKNTLGGFLNLYPVLMTELNYSRIQLANLKYDVENKQIKQDVFNLYFDQEKQSVRVLKLKMDHNSRMIDISIQNYNALEPEIESLTDSLHQKNEYQ